MGRATLHPGDPSAEIMSSIRAQLPQLGLWVSLIKRELVYIFLRHKRDVRRHAVPQKLLSSIQSTVCQTSSGLDELFKRTMRSGVRWGSKVWYCFG